MDLEVCAPPYSGSRALSPHISRANEGTVHGAPALAGQTQFHQRSPSVSSRLSRANTLPAKAGTPYTVAGLRFGVNLRAFFYKLAGLFLHPLLEGLLVADALFGGVFADIFGDLHRAEVRAAHGAEMGQLRALLREGLVVEVAGGGRVEAQVELVFPAELEAGFAERIVALVGRRMALGQVRGM